jgi:hypothetical protein
VHLGLILPNFGQGSTPKEIRRVAEAAEELGIYVGKGREVRSFDYASGTASASFTIAGARGITGMDFSANGGSLRHAE